MPHTITPTLPPLLRVASWAAGLGWAPLIAGFLLAAFGPDHLVPALSSAALLLLLYFVAALCAAVISGLRQPGETRHVAWTAAAVALTGAASSGALVALAPLLQVE